jgi:hypothetical protein
MKNKKRLFLSGLVGFVLLTSIFLTACGTSPGSDGSGVPANGQTLMQERCSVCHSTGRITSAHKTADQWKATVDRMISHGANLTAAEETTLVDYLAANYK